MRCPAQSEGVAEGGDDGADEEGEQDAGEGDEEEQKPKIEVGLVISSIEVVSK